MKTGFLLGFNKKLIIRTIATVLLIEGVAMVPAGVLALFDGDISAGKGILISAGIILAIALMGRLYVGNHATKIKARESYFIVLVSWITAITAGMFPYLLAVKDFGFVNALFESAATWTTTNAWVVDINMLPRGLVLWKATSSWLGGMGIILLTIIIFTALGVGGQKLAGAEIAGPELEKHTARIADTAKLLYVLYGVGSLIEVILLKATGLPIFDAVINTMSSISTSGTMDYNNVLSAHFTSAVKIVIVLFSILASLNFAVYVRIIKRKYKDALRDFEMNTFLIIIASATVIISLILFLGGTYTSLWDSFLNSITGVVSFACTTGFTLEHVEYWPGATKFMLMVLMLIGGCAASTAGGIKIIRFSVLVKLVNRGVYKRIHPRAVKPVMIRNESVSTANATSISTYVLLFFAVYLLGCWLLSLENLDMETTITAPMALLTNCGEGFGAVSGAGYGFFSSPGKLVCVLLMIMGRLEIYALLILVSRSFWNPNRAS
ncbi:MAG: TrkH family potassium uptake protein [Firmicutes bacterium]|nr:TrkH family potassium uptake protein [Bacillota bacterium]